MLFPFLVRVSFCRDNAVMIAWTGLYKMKYHKMIPPSLVETVDFDSNLELL